MPAGGWLGNRWLCLCLFLVVALPLKADLVKRSSSGLCHPPESSWFERTKNFTAFDSLKSCLQAGGRLPSGVKAPGTGSKSNAPSPDDYERSAFGHGWDDADGDCEDARAEALIATSTTTVRFAPANPCRVVTGRWISPFTNQVIQNASDIDIDHLVPLAWAWGRGAQAWNAEKREQFANDQRNLLPVEASLNRSKGARPPSEWLPPQGRCGYVTRFKRLVLIYGLAFSESERRYVDQFLMGCRVKVSSGNERPNNG